MAQHRLWCAPSSASFPRPAQLSLRPGCRLFQTLALWDTVRTMTDTSIPSLLYRLVHAADWQAAAGAGAYRGAAHDLADGFVHMSTAEQVPGTAARYYQGLPDILLLTLDSARLHGEVKMEPSTGGKLYPHLYGDIPLEAVLAVEPLKLDSEGQLIVPYLRGV